MSKLPGCRLVHALNSLSDGERTVLYYVYVEGYQYHETAEALGFPRARSRLASTAGGAGFGRHWRRYRFDVRPSLVGDRRPGGSVADTPRRWGPVMSWTLE
jgi:hypothetical protein